MNAGVSSRSVVSLLALSNPLRGSSASPTLVCRRHESSFRRLKQRLRVKPDASFLPGTSTQHDHIIFNPPSSAPSVYQTPLKFIPKHDKRRAILAAIDRDSQSRQTSPSTLPPPIREPYEKRYHLSEADIAEIRRLRTENPEVWTRAKLAEKFACSSLFIGMVCEAGAERKQQQKEILEAVKSRWGLRRRTAREDRARRRETWGRYE